MDSKHLKIIADYLQRGYKWFSFDTLYIGNREQSREPIAYRFKTKSVYYPLEVSSLQKGKTKIDLLIILPEYTKSNIRWPRNPFKHINTTYIDSENLSPISPEWAKFMQWKNVDVSWLSCESDLSALRRDLIVSITSPINTDGK